MDKVFGKYRIAAPITPGSPNAAYHARSITGFEWNMVVKVYATRLLHAQEEEAFRQHMAVLSQLEYPHILPITDYGIEKNVPFCVTEYITYGSLRDRLEHRSSVQLSMQAMITIIAQIGRALQYAHDHHSIHGNIKPENILFNKYNDVLLTDFSLPEKIGGNTSGGPNNATQSTYYQAFEDLNEKSDQYALGYLADELFSELLPASSFALVSPPEQYTLASAAHPTFEVSKQVRATLLKAMARDPNERYTDIAAFVEALNEVYAIQSMMTTSSSSALTTPWPASNGLQSAKTLTEHPILSRLKKQHPQSKNASVRGPLLITIILLLFGILSVGPIWQFSLALFLQKSPSSIIPLASPGTVTIATPSGLAQLEPTLVVTPTVLGTVVSSTTTPKVRLSPTVVPAISPTAVPVTPPTAVVPFPTAVMPTPTIVPTQAPILTIACHVNYRPSHWDSSFETDITITNTSTIPINGWSLQWTFVSDQKITNVWNAYVSQVGQNVTMSNISWNASILPGTSTNSIGFSGTYSGTLSNPVGFILNGTVCN